MEFNGIIASSNSTCTSTPTNSTCFNQEENTSSHVIFPPLRLDASLYSSSNQPFFLPEEHDFLLPSDPYQGYQLNETQSCPQIFSSNYFDPSTLPVFPPMFDQNGAAPNPFAEGVSPNTHRRQKWDSNESKAARSKRKMAMRMTFLSSSSRTSINGTATENVDNNDVYNFITPDGKKLKFLLQKVLKNSDTSNLGRIVLPKRPSEEYLPNLSDKEGIQITIREVESTNVWEMKYRYWPNLNSRMYILENTGEYIKQNELAVGDYVMIYKDVENQLYISCRKAEAVNDESQREVKRLKKDTLSEGNIDGFDYNVSNKLEQAEGKDGVDCSVSNTIFVEDGTKLDDILIDDFEDFDIIEKYIANWNEYESSLFDNDDLTMQNNYGDDNDKGGNASVGIPE